MPHPVDRPEALSDVVSAVPPGEPPDATAGQPPERQDIRLDADALEAFTAAVCRRSALRSTSQPTSRPSSLPPTGEASRPMAPPGCRARGPRRRRRHGSGRPPGHRRRSGCLRPVRRREWLGPPCRSDRHRLGYRDGADDRHRSRDRPERQSLRVAGWYALRAAAEGMIGISMTNTTGSVAPTRSSTGLIGTNPIAIAAPAGHRSAFSLDMATSTVPRGKLEVAERRGRRSRSAGRSTARATRRQTRPRRSRALSCRSAGSRRRPATRATDSPSRSMCSPGSWPAQRSASGSRDCRYRRAVGSRAALPCHRSGRDRRCGRFRRTARRLP